MEKTLNDLIKPIEKDQDLIRIKSKIEWLNNLICYGPISMLIKLLVSWMVTMEISNGSEKVTIQEIMIEFKDRVVRLNKMFDELCFGLDFIDDVNKRRIEKDQFRVKLYKLFDIGDILQTAIKKCVSMGNTMNRLSPLLMKFINPLTVLMIDGIFLTNTDAEFEKLMFDYIHERVMTIEDPIKRKLEKIRILNKLLDDVLKEPVDMSYYKKTGCPEYNPDKNVLKELELNSFIELTNKLHKKA